MESIGVIPARFESKRLPGKPLLDICGKPMIQHVYEEARKARLLERILVATDDERIRDAVQSFGGDVVLTSRAHKSGTDRVAEAVLNLTCRVIVNIQGDEPMIRHQMLDELVQPFMKDDNIVMATLSHRIYKKTEIDNSNIVKVVVDKDGTALYFSRSPIPWRDGSSPCYKHIGVYAYTKDFLMTFTRLAQSPLEKIERLEQLRALENGYKIKVVETGFDTISVDTEEDLKEVREILCSRSMQSQNISL